MLCDHCLNNFVIPRLREDDIAILQYLYNKNIILSQTALTKDAITKGVKLSPFRCAMALCRLECYDIIKLNHWSKAHLYHLTNEGIKAITILFQKMEER